MLVVGIDPGIATTGYGFVREKDDGLTVVDYGAILTSPSDSQEKRLQIIHEKIKELLLLHKPDSGAVEKLFFQKNVTTAIGVGQARGVILLALSECGIPLGEYSPREIKQAITGYGGAQKMQMQQMVKAILGLQDIPRPDDAADALSIAICHIHSSKVQNLIDLK
jgi:crossover junction endodeoxyribonuclease RuvC